MLIFLGKKAAIPMAVEELRDPLRVSLISNHFKSLSPLRPLAGVFPPLITANV